MTDPYGSYRGAPLCLPRCSSPNQPRKRTSEKIITAPDPAEQTTTKTRSPKVEARGGNNCRSREKPARTSGSKSFGERPEATSDEETGSSRVGRGPNSENTAARSNPKVRDCFRVLSITSENLARFVDLRMSETRVIPPLAVLSRASERGGRRPWRGWLCLWRVS